MCAKSKLSRREFLRFSAVGAAGALLLPGSLTAAPQKSSKKTSANDTINLGFIGLGRQAMYLLGGFMSIDGVKVVAGCDIYGIKRARFEKRVKDYYTQNGQKSDVKMYTDYKEVLARPDIDAVVIATPDHYHAIIAMDACRAGKDIYLEKPMTFTIYEGQQLRKAVRDNNIIMQVGSQQRSSEEFIHVANFVREGGLGKIQKVKAHVGGHPVPYDLPEETVPLDLDWDTWLGPLPKYYHYNPDLNPPITLDPPQNEQVWGAWRWYEGMGGGLMTDWGAHMFDIVQWCLGKDGSGPSEIIPAGYSYYDHLTYIYDNGIVVTQEKFDGGKQGVKLYGEKGWIQVCRDEVMASDPDFLPKNTGDSDLPYETKIPHMLTFIDSVRTRRDPNVPVEVGHSSCTMCTLGNIAHELNRPVSWNPIVEKFVNDPEATKLLHYDYRAGYSL